MLHRNAREVRDLLPQARQAVEERRFAGIGRSYERDDMRGRRGGLVRRVCGAVGAVVAGAHLLDTHFETAPCPFRRRTSLAAVSRRKAISDPSTRKMRGS